MISVLVDHNIEGHAILLWGTLAADGWLAIVPVALATFADVGLPQDADDRQVWRFCQTHEMLLLTANRAMRGPDSLEQAIREENTPRCLPVLTIGSPDRMDEKSYRKACAVRLLEVVLDFEACRGAGRLYIP